MKRLILIMIAALCIGTSYSQKNITRDDKKFRLSIGAEAALPIGNFAKNYSIGGGATIQANYSISKNLDLVFNTGLLNFKGTIRTFPTVGAIKFPNQNYIPLLAGINYHFNDKVFGVAQLGTTLISTKDQNGSYSSLTSVPGIGYKFSKNLDAVLKYTLYTGSGMGAASSIGIRLGYTF